jgi:site-specific DNA recombinase
METFETHRISFVSVTQQFNTATSMGRLVLNVLLSFAQFEREIIAERTRDKIAATRRKGKWAGGRPLLGYDVDPRGRKLVVNADEAERVRSIFALYLEHEALLPVVQELERRGWCNKRWQTRKGHERGGQPFTKTSLHRLLTNVSYAGQVRYKDEIHGGEQPAIVDLATFQRAQQVLARNGVNGGATVRNQFGALLKGILRCAPCGCAMTPAHCKKGERRYRYYTCVSAQKRGWQTCPSKSIPAGEIEALVVEQLRCVGRDAVLRREVLDQARLLADEQMAALEAEVRVLDRDLARWHSDLHDLSCQLRPGEDNSPLLARLADLQERIRATEERAQQVRERLRAVQEGLLDDDEAAAALSVFDPIWEMLTPREQAKVVGLLVQRVDYDGGQGKLSITFHPTGIEALADEWATQREEQIA